MPRFNLVSVLDLEFSSLSEVTLEEVNEAKDELRRALSSQMSLMHRTARVAQRSMLESGQNLDTFEQRLRAARVTMLRAELLEALLGWRLTISSGDAGDWEPYDDGTASID